MRVYPAPWAPDSLPTLALSLTELQSAGQRGDLRNYCVIRVLPEFDALHSPWYSNGISSVDATQYAGHWLPAPREFYPPSRHRDLDYIEAYGYVWTQNSLEDSPVVRWLFNSSACAEVV